ncbi:hypothetical protein Acr_01g0006710 [Actinidia rufa]|uniref:Uncharacterized protein n=1 Tax=Actinidia rufa TaxID=165716 RepID=A0A7J0E3M2_9ERIC|nr:hypothetical protein Acr_01g0006710 [Actinidia rufa]
MECDMIGDAGNVICDVHGHPRREAVEIHHPLILLWNSKTTTKNLNQFLDDPEAFVARLYTISHTVIQTSMYSSEVCRLHSPPVSCVDEDTLNLLCIFILGQLLGIPNTLALAMSTALSLNLFIAALTHCGLHASHIRVTRRRRSLRQDSRSLDRPGLDQRAFDEVKEATTEPEWAPVGLDWLQRVLLRPDLAHWSLDKVLKASTGLDECRRGFLVKAESLLESQSLLALLHHTPLCAAEVVDESPGFVAPEVSPFSHQRSYEVRTTVSATTEAGPSADGEGQHPGLSDHELGAQQPAHSPIDNQPSTSPDASDGSGNPRTSLVSMTPMLVSNRSCKGTPQKDPNEPEASICINDEVLPMDPSSRVPFMRWRVRPDAFSVLKLAFERHPETFENFNLAKILLDLDDTDLGVITQPELENVLLTLNDLTAVGFNVEWLRCRVHKVKALVNRKL